MEQIILTFLFLNVVAFVAIKIFKKLFAEDSNDTFRVKQVLKAPEENHIPDNQPTTLYYQPEISNPYRKKSALPRLLIFTIAIGVLIFYNQDVIKTFAARNMETTQNLEAEENAFATDNETSFKPVSQTKVDGVFWYEISGTNANGEKFHGWVSEFSIKPEPAKKSELIDSVSQKLGLPTTEERVEYIKKLKGINSALKTALEKN